MMRAPPVGASFAPSLLLLFVTLLSTAGPAQAPSPEASPEGRWRLSLRLPIVQKAPVLGDLERAFVLSGLVDVRAKGDGFLQRTRACDVRITGGGFATRVEVPDGFSDAIRVPVSSLESTPEGIVTVLRDIHLGYEGREGTSPPGEADDPRVRDSDADGHPGVTVVLRVLELGEVELYVAQHLHLRLEGVKRGEGRYEGVVRVVRFEQRLLGSEPRIPGLTDDLETRAEDGRFTLERVREGTPCEGLGAE